MKKRRTTLLSMFTAAFCLLAVKMAFAQQGVAPLPTLKIALEGAKSTGEVATTLQIIALLTVLGAVPTILLMVTSFTRIIVVLGFVRRALGLQQTPPNQVIIALALFLTLFIMAPVWNRVYEDGLSPYLDGRLGTTDAITRSVAPVREFMLNQTREDELSLMVSVSGGARPENASQIPITVLLPAFMLSELKSAFQMGVVIFIPFVVVDMIISSVLMSMGMMMLPPMMISLPFKVLLFVMADGWNLVIVSLIKSFK